MYNIETIFLFTLIFSILVVTRTIIKVFGALLRNPPERYEISSRELILVGLSFSYLLTYYLQGVL